MHELEFLWFLSAGDIESDPDLKIAMGEALYDLATKLDLPNPSFLGQRFDQSDTLAREARQAARIANPFRKFSKPARSPAHAAAGVTVGCGEEDVDVAWDAVASEMREAIGVHGKRYSHGEALTVVKRHTRLVTSGGGSATADVI